MDFFLSVLKWADFKSSTTNVNTEKPLQMPHTVTPVGSLIGQILF